MFRHAGEGLRLESNERATKTGRRPVPINVSPSDFTLTKPFGQGATGRDGELQGNMTSTLDGERLCKTWDGGDETRDVSDALQHCGY